MLGVDFVTHDARACSYQLHMAIYQITFPFPTIFVKNKLTQ